LKRTLLRKKSKPSLGHGIVITQHAQLQYYLSLLNMQLPVESQMVASLADVLIAELVLQTVQNRRDAVLWLGYTYLFVRLQKNPTLYGISGAFHTDPTLTQVRVDLVHAALSLLHRHNLIKYEKRSGQITVTPIGQVASQYYIKHPSIMTYNETLRPTMGDIELLRLFSMSNEFKNIPVRADEKAELAKLLEKVPIPVEGTADESTAKVNVLLQAYISGLNLNGFAIQADMVYIHQSAARIMRALFEICLRKKWSSLAVRGIVIGDIGILHNA
jgi:pre-mRNA-splicing helicase BRR2